MSHDYDGDHHHHHDCIVGSPYHCYYPGYGYWGPYYGFSIGFGFGWGCYPYYAGYYSAYPWGYWDPWWHYPYYRGVYVAYPYYYGDGGGTYIYNNYYYDDSSSAAAPDDSSIVSSEPAQPLSPPVRGPSDDRISPLPKAESVEQTEAQAAGHEAPAAEATGEGPPAASLALSGLADFRDGRYMEASENLFAASQADPSSQALKVYLAESLIAIGEYGYAADYLRQALAARPALALQSFSLGRLYAASPEGQADLEAHLKLLEDHVSLKTYDSDALLVLGFVQMQDADIAGASSSFMALYDSSLSSVNQAIATSLLGAVQVRSLAQTGGFEDHVSPFVASIEEPAGAEADELGDTLSEALY